MKDINSNLTNSTNKGTLYPKKQLKDKNKSDLLKMPLEIINELNQEEIASPEVVKDKLDKFDYEEKKEIKLRIFNVEIQDPSLKSEENKLIVDKSRSFVENNTIHNTVHKRRSNKGSLNHNKTSSIDSWRNLSIGMIVPHIKLNSQLLDGILLQGEVFKFIFDENSHKHSSNYSSKFFVINKTEFTYYKSKESFLSLQNPLSKISLFQIKNVNRLSHISKEYTLNKNYHHLIIELHSELDRKSFIENLECLSNIHKDSSKSNQVSNNISQLNFLNESNDKSNLASLLNEMNKNNGICDVKFKKVNKISLIKSVDIGKISSSLDKFTSILENQNKHANDGVNNLKFNSNVNKKNFFIFGGKSHEIINKIVYLLNYLLEKEIN